MKARVQQSLALFELAERESYAGDDLPAVPLPKALVVPCPGERCQRARAAYPDLELACVLCKCGRPKEPICGRCRLLLAQLEEFEAQAMKRMEEVA